MTQDRQVKAFEKLATAMLQSYKFEVVYRRALAYSRKDTVYSWHWSNFARWAHIKLTEAVDKENEALHDLVSASETVLGPMGNDGPR